MRPNIRISAVCQQQLDHVSTARSERFEQCRSTVDLPVVDVGAALKQLACGSRVAHAYSREQRRLAVVVHQLFQLGAVLNQQLDDVTIVKDNSAAQWRFGSRAAATNLQKMHLA